VRVQRADMAGAPVGGDVVVVVGRHWKYLFLWKGAKSQRERTREKPAQGALGKAALVRVRRAEAGGRARGARAYVALDLSRHAPPPPAPARTSKPPSVLQAAGDRVGENLPPEELETERALVTGTCQCARLRVEVTRPGDTE